MKSPVHAPHGMKRQLGSPVLFGLVQSFIAAALYFSLGVAADRAAGWTWVVYLAAAVFFVLTALSYVEGASLHQERGGATVMARYAFNELWSFVAGWAILLDCVLLIALTSFITTDYLAVFWAPLGEGGSEFFFGAALVLAIAFINVRGLDPLSFGRIAWLGIVDLGVQVLLLIAGLALLYDPSILTDPASFGGGGDGVGLDDALFAFTLAIVACTGLDSSAGFAGQVAIGRKGLRRLLAVRSLAVFVPYFGLVLVALSTLGTSDGLLAEGTGRQDLDAPLLGVTAAFSDALLRDAASYAIALSAAAVCFATCAAAMLGLSRIGYSLALNRQIPSAAGRLHPRFKTPVVVIGVGTVLALVLLSTGDVEFLLGTYAFGATIGFTLVHLGVLRMRRTEPERDRPYRVPLNVRVGGTSWPVPSVLGAVLSIASFGAVLWLHPGSRVVGPVWMVIGLTLYVSYRLSQDKPLLRRVTIPERTLTRTKAAGTEFDSILVPILGTPLDDDIVQTAGRLVAGVAPDEDSRDSVQIEAMWVFVIPMALPLDGRIPEGERKRSQAALARAKAVGEEYAGIEVGTFSVRARSAGDAIVREARRRGVEAIVMPAEEPTRIRGGVLLGGQRGLRDTFVGETTRYVVNKAHCRVILTAPPDEDRVARDEIPLGHRAPGPS